MVSYLENHGKNRVTLNPEWLLIIRFPDPRRFENLTFPKIGPMSICRTRSRDFCSKKDARFS
jgi:hypothetical protein